MARIFLTDPKIAPPLVIHEHGVPRFYLNKFADSEKYVIVYAKDRAPRRRSTKGETAEPNYFEYTINGQATENRYERWFQRIETDAAAVYGTIQSGSALTGTQERAWSLFIASTFLRSRKVREQIGPALTKRVASEMFFGDGQIREMQHDLLKQGIFAYADELRVKAKQIKREMEVPAFGHLAGIEENARGIADDIFRKRWFVLQAAPGTTFVTSDCPVHTQNVNLAGKSFTLGSGFSHPSTAVVLPLSPSRLFLAGPNEMRWKSNVLDENDVLAFNAGAVRFADRAVYALDQSDEIRGLVDREINQVVYGRNAFVPLNTTIN